MEINFEIKQIIELSERNLSKAYRIIKELQIKEIWESLGSTCNLVGSVKNRLLLNHLDIDFHTYSEPFSITKSFQAIARICEHPGIQNATYKNLLEAEDRCLEWHLSYLDNENCCWTIDIIHIKNDSAYAGMVERITEKIGNRLTEKIREAILRIKWESTHSNEKVTGIEIYQAVIEGGAYDYDTFKEWKKHHPNTYISLWEPS